jgi:hypothetical protein
VCYLIFPAGGGRQEPLLNDGIENPETPVENPKKADKPESKTGMVVLGAGLAVSVLVNVILIWKGPKIFHDGYLAETVQQIHKQLRAEKPPDKTAVAREELDKLESDNAKMQLSNEKLKGWVRTFQAWFREILNGTQIKNKEQLQVIVNEKIEILEWLPFADISIF